MSLATYDGSHQETGGAVTPVEYEAEWRADYELVTRLRGRCDDVTKLFRQTFTATGWPYELKDAETTKRPIAPSTTTHAMILHAMAANAGLLPKSILAPDTHRRSEGNQGLSHSIAFGIHWLVDEMRKHPLKDPTAFTYSPTWGTDDPLTLMWLLELLDAELDVSELRDFRDNLHNVCRSRVAEALSQPSNPVLKTDHAAAVLHTFPLLRIIHIREYLRRSATSVGKADTAKASTRVTEDLLLTQLHKQLSYSEIGDSGFDPAQLIFACEGLVILREGSLTTALLQRVKQVLQLVAERDHFWRPARPITVTSQGLVLLPQSVEIANSCLRISRYLSEPAGQGSAWFGDNLRVMRRFTSWLDANSISGATAEGEAFAGWQSEHTFQSGVVDLWATSQVQLFFRYFSTLLSEHMADQRLEVSNLFPSRAVTKDDWNELLQLERTSPFTVPCEVTPYQLLERDFVAPRYAGGGSDFYWSALLYGPPGTGKTSLARNLAMQLGWRLLSISPSDFIEGGTADVERRAKELFKTLDAQSDLVVFFDEIDRLLLDRDSNAYGRQDDMFQFMTPSMLTKFNDLRGRERCIFLIGTNYAERIDSAIKRRGRIDREVLVLPPFGAQRRTYVQSELRDNDATTTWENSADWGNEAKLQRVAKETALFTYGDLDGAIDETIRALLNSGQHPLDIFVEICSGFRPTISLESYQARFTADGGKPPFPQRPVKELFGLLYLCAEVGDTIPEAVVDVARAAINDEDVRSLPANLVSAVRPLLGD
jgi:hypothetical protein